MPAATSCESAYADIYKRSADLFKVGARLEDTLRIGVERGDYPAASGREEAWIKERLELLYKPGKQHEQVLADGRCVLIEERQTSDGGIIGLRMDITDLKQREASFRLLLRTILSDVRAAARSPAFLAANAAAISHYGHSREQVLAMTLTTCAPSADRQARRPISSRPASTPPSIARAMAARSRSSCSR
jgi:hypothetical protein